MEPPFPLDGGCVRAVIDAGEVLLGIELPKLRLHAKEASAPAKLRLALRLSNGSGDRLWA